MPEEVKWEVESLRATAFHQVGGSPHNIDQLWNLVMHRRPDQIVSRPGEGLQVAEGSFGGSDKQLQCTIRPERVDWVLQAAPLPPNQPREGLATAGSLEGVLIPFRDLSVEWLKRSPAVTRLAFGAVLLAEVDDLRDANVMLDTLLPAVNLDPENASDFLYRVNRRRLMASSPGMSANRISTWSVAQSGTVGFVIAGNSPPQITSSAGRFSCRLDLDVNTVDMFPSPLGGAQAAELFNELVALGKEITEKGDIP